MLTPEELKIAADKQDKTNKKFYNLLKRKSPRDLDDRVHELHDEVFENTDCLQCANCCKTTSPIFYDGDIEHLSKRLRMKPAEFIEKYLRVDEDKDYVLTSSPCPFLDHENYCTVYNDRPTACRRYPHTDRKRMHQVLELTYKNTFVCPAVYEITERLKKIYPLL